LPYLDVSNVSVRQGRKEILGNVGFQAGRGEIVSLIGPSGSGKTTMLRALIGLQGAQSGTVTVDGRWIDLSAPNAAASLRHKAAIVFQNFGLFDHMSVLRNLTLAPTLVHKRPGDEAEKEARTLLKRLGIEDKAKLSPRELSGGQKQRVAIARALMQRPALLLLDEPTSALDPARVREVGHLMQDLAAEGMTIIQVSHAMQAVRSLSSRIILLQEGRVIHAADSADAATPDHPIARFMNSQDAQDNMA